jgi:hypothetical protein
MQGNPLAAVGKLEGRGLWDLANTAYDKLNKNQTSGEAPIRRNRRPSSPARTSPRDPNLLFRPAAAAPFRQLQPQSES